MHYGYHGDIIIYAKNILIYAMNILLFILATYCHYIIVYMKSLPICYFVMFYTFKIHSIIIRYRISVSSLMFTFLGYP